MKTMKYNLADFSAFLVCGQTRDGARFRNEYSDCPDRPHCPGIIGAATMAFGINLWRGRVYGIERSSGKRRLLKSVTN